MANYKGFKCIVCDRDFEETDDIVVCPECGTPYHRDCYNQVGECINTSLHAEGGSWRQINNKDEVESEETEQPDIIICPRCGFSNEKGENFCSQCGLPLDAYFENKDNPFNDFGNDRQGYGSQQGQPFNPFMGGFVSVEDDTDIDGVRARDIADYVGSNKFYFLAQFMRFAKLKIKRSFNFCAFLFPEYYYFYRKMLGYGFFFLTFKIAMSVFLQSMFLKFGMSTGVETAEIVEKISASPLWSGVFFGLSLLSLVLCIISGMFSNFWYFKKTKQDILEIDQVPQTDTQRKFTIAQKGGTSFGIAIGAVVAYQLIIRVILLLIS